MCTLCRIVSDFKVTTNRTGTMFDFQMKYTAALDLKASFVLLKSLEKGTVGIVFKSN
jgi:hypothetical protein